MYGFRPAKITCTRERIFPSAGDFWQGASVTDSSGHGIGDTPYTLAPVGTDYPGAVMIVDSAPLASPLSAYTVTKSASITNFSGVGGLTQPGGFFQQPGNPSA